MNHDKLKQVIQDHAIKRQTVVLSSGKTSDIYYDIRELMSDPDHMSLVAEVFLSKNRKKYGLQKQVEGILKPPVAIVDDVLYSGTSISIALTELDKINVPVSAIIPLIFRGDEKKLQEAHDMFGKKIYPIFMEEELI